MLSRKIIGVASDNNKRHKYIVQKMRRFLNVTSGGSKHLNRSCIPCVLFSFKCDVMLMWN